MRYDFSEMIDRRHTDSVKWDVKDNELPMWAVSYTHLTLPTKA